MSCVVYMFAEPRKYIPKPVRYNWIMRGMSRNKWLRVRQNYREEWKHYRMGVWAEHMGRVVPHLEVAQLDMGCGSEQEWPIWRKIFPEGSRITRQKIWRAKRRGLLRDRDFDWLTQQLGLYVVYVHA